MRKLPSDRLTYGIGLAAVAVLLLVSGCTLAPQGTVEEKSRLREAGAGYEHPAENRSLPALSDEPSWQEVLRRAFLANGEIEASYFEWAAAVARIDQASAYPNSNLALGLEYMFSGEKLKAWDRTTVSAGFDPAMSLSFPTKVAKAGGVALEEARSAGSRFRAAKFDLQRRVLIAYFELALTEEKIRIQRDNVSLLELLRQTADARVKAGGPQQDLLRFQIEHRLAENDLRNTEAEARSMRAMLNGMLAREAQAELKLASLPRPRPLAAADDRLIAAGVEQNPELAGLAQRVAGRHEALDLARQAYIPDINPLAAINGDLSQTLGAMVIFPTALPKIRGLVEESRAMLRASEAMARQTRNDRAASFVAALYRMRNAERQGSLLQDQVLPAAEQSLSSLRQGFVAGGVSFIDLIDSQRTLLEVRLLIAEVRTEREKRLVEIEALAGTDIETLGKAGPASASTRPTTVATERGKGSEP